MKIEEAKCIKTQYSHLHPLIFHRSIEYAKNLSELYDILEDIPDQYPVKWSYEKNKWESVETPCLVENLKYNIFGE